MRRGNFRQASVQNCEAKKNSYFAVIRRRKIDHPRVRNFVQIAYLYTHRNPLRRSHITII